MSASEILHISGNMEAETTLTQEMVPYKSYKLLIKGAKQIVQVCDKRQELLLGKAMDKIAVLNSDDNDLAVLVNSNGNISAVGTYSQIITEKNISIEEISQVIDAKGGCILPGLIDGHTHPVYAGDRAHEFALKLAGATYMEVHKAGGGINFTVGHTRLATEDELFNSFKKSLLRMIRCGTTLVECKSGFGLDTENELKMLRVIQRARNDESIKIDIYTTFCGAHSVPKGMTSNESTDDVINNQIPAVKREMDAGRLQVDAVDVFCETGVFDVEQSRKILQAGVEAGMEINFHGDELSAINSAEMGAELNARAISHLEEISEEGIAAMAKSKSAAVILPTTAYILRLKHPPVRKMIEQGVPVALGSDYNPNAFCLSMPVTMHLACVNFRMTLAEAIAASTINAAYSLRKSQSHGSIEAGKKANMIILDAPKWEHLIYQLAGHDEIITTVTHGGDIAYQKAV